MLHGRASVEVAVPRPNELNTGIIIIIMTRISCLEARRVCRRAAVKAAKILPLVRLARAKQDPINREHGAQYLYRPPPAGAEVEYWKTHNGNPNSE